MCQAHDKRLIAKDRAMPQKLPFKMSGMMLFNTGVALFLLTTAGLAMRATFVKEQAPVCTQRYQNALLYPWAMADGRPYSAADLQAKLGGFDWGVIDNVRFVAGVPVISKVAIEVGLPKDARTQSSESDELKRRSGMGFAWQPSRIKDAEHACLGYSVFIPAGLEAGGGLSLPGFFGNVDAEPLGDRQPVFSSRMRWRDETRLDVVVVGPENPVGMALQLDPQHFKLERGRWVRIDQEIAMNTPGRRDGLLRVWIDGDLKLEQKNVVYRQDLSQGLRGVDASVHYSRPNHAWSPSPKDGAIRLSPFEVRWR